MPLFEIIIETFKYKMKIFLELCSINLNKLPFLQDCIDFVYNTTLEINRHT